MLLHDCRCGLVAVLPSPYCLFGHRPLAGLIVLLGAAWLIHLPEAVIAVRGDVDAARGLVYVAQALG